MNRTSYIASAVAAVLVLPIAASAGPAAGFPAALNGLAAAREVFADHPPGGKAN